ncbi:MAG TPA: zf-HC2 domain-containing protein [Longimicrobiales bacterium]|nr:zf-HC2 domain-containing protein [Longimicrobiales bacterium]
MNHIACGTVRELIPDFVSSRLGSHDLEVVDAHIGECGACRAELELAKMLLASRSRVPAGLAERVTRAVRADRRATSRPWWGLTAAAVAALALGIGMSSERSQAPLEVPGFAYEVEEEDAWLSDDGLVAGAPMFEGLSDDALVALLDELSLEQSGGAA